MIYISDGEQQVGEFGGVGTVEFFYEVARELKLEQLQSFIDNGFTIDIASVIDELRSVDWPTVDGYNEVASEVAKALLKCSDLAILE